jgi:two-component SAPR family response regulator
MKGSSKMVRIMLVDDEEHALNELEYMLDKESGIEIIGKYTDPEEARTDILLKKPDAVFLDIEMPYLNGLDLAKEILNSGEKIDFIFVTAYDEYLSRIQNLNALAYILKPVSGEQLNEVIKELHKHHK